MITVDISALVEIVLDRSLSDACMRALAGERDIKISSVNIAEALVVASGRGVVREMEALIREVALDILPVTPAAARQVAEVYRRWGRGFHPAALNFGDCFAYVVASSHGGRLLFGGEDFARTDLESVLPAPRP